MNAPAVKICGITRWEDAEFVNGKADYLGFVLHPASPRRVDFETLCDLACEVSSLRVAVVVNPHKALVRRLLDDRIVDIVQLHGDEPPEFARLFDRGRIWKAVHLSDESQLDAFAAYPADRMVVDAARGGSGRNCDWALAARAAAIRPVLLAGGITPENAAAAVRTVNPCGIDLASGVELSPGVKDHRKINLLFERLQA